MCMILVPLATPLLCFLASAACLRFVLSRQGWFWVLPLFISAAFLYISIDPLMKVATGLTSGPYMVEISPDRSVREIIPLIIVFLWYSMIITFRYALKMVVPVNRHLINTEKNLKESRYMEKVELRRRKKTMRKKARRSDIMSRMQQGKNYTQDWVKLFDDE